MSTRFKTPFVRVAFLFSLLVPMSATAQAETLVPFEIKDQHDRVHRDTDFSGKVVILTGSDGEGSQFNGLWVSAIREALEADPRFETVTFLDVADVRGVPFFLKGTVKGRFPSAEEDWVLMDWGGFFAKTYGFEPKSTNMAVFGEDGRLACRAHGREVDPEVLDRVVTKIREVLSAG
ncbi:MAG: hypothetical protein HKO65_00460 [Gemmatimonadetes bacterium]|nr:hypothetical protein [Gemmatimonadota bacterium]NNM03544.1 hypothetical protein [Gemmatimonadota bacterium]